VPPLRRRGAIRSRRIHRGYSTDILSRFADAYFDWIYIDGNHLFDFVKADLELGYRKVRRGGLITGDDYLRGRMVGGGREACG
jgi:predicted O-methyltransferase YrrM